MRRLAGKYFVYVGEGIMYQYVTQYSVDVSLFDKAVIYGDSFMGSYVEFLRIYWCV